jgi:carboxymethylenebutenolidase
MCEKDHFEEDLEKYIRAGRVTRRDFGSLTAGAGLAMMLPRAADAQAVTEKDVEIRTPDGVCDAYFVHPGWRARGRAVWPTSSACARRSGRWASGSPSRAIRC